MNRRLLTPLQAELIVALREIVLVRGYADEPLLETVPEPLAPPPPPPPLVLCAVAAVMVPWGGPTMVPPPFAVAASPPSTGKGYDTWFFMARLFDPRNEGNRLPDIGSVNRSPRTLPRRGAGAAPSARVECDRVSELLPFENADGREGSYPLSVNAASDGRDRRDVRDRGGIEDSITEGRGLWVSQL